MRTVTSSKTETTDSYDENEWDQMLMITGCVQFIRYGNASNKHHNAGGGLRQTSGVKQGSLLDSSSGQTEHLMQKIHHSPQNNDPFT